MTSQNLQQALADMYARAVGFLPSLLLSLVFLLASWVVARMLGNVAGRISRRLHLDESLSGSALAQGLERAQVTMTASQLIGRSVFWLVFISLLPVGIVSLGIGPAAAPLAALVEYIPHLIAGLLVVIVGAVVAQAFGRFTQAGAAGLGVEFDRGLGTAVAWLVFIAALIIGLQQLGLEVSLLTNTLTNVLTISVAGLALAFGLGGRDVVRNVLAGYYAREQFSLGESLEIDGLVGSLDSIGTLNATLITADGRVSLPNRDLIEHKVRIRPTE